MTMLWFQIVLVFLVSHPGRAADQTGPSIRDLNQAVDAYVDGERPDGVGEKRNSVFDIVEAVARLRDHSAGPNVDQLVWAFARLTAHALGRSAAEAAETGQPWIHARGMPSPGMYHADVQVFLAPTADGRVAAIAVLEDLSRTNLDDHVRTLAASALEVVYGALFTIAVGDGTPEELVRPRANRIRIEAVAMLAAGGHPAAIPYVRHLLDASEFGGKVSPLIKIAATRALTHLLLERDPDQMAAACLKILDAQIPVRPRLSAAAG